MPALALAALLAAAAPPAPSPSPSPSPPVLARIGDWTLTLDLFEAYWRALPAGRRSSYEARGGRRAFLGDLVDTKLMVAEAERTGIAARPEVRAAAEMARDTVLYRAIFEAEVTNQIVTKEAIRAYYDAHKERYRIEEHARARQIVVTPGKDRKLHNTSGDDAVTAADAEAKAARLLEELRRGADFAAVARRDSEDATAPSGGRLEDFPRGRMAKPIEDAVFALKPGELSEVIRSPYGFHILKLEELLPARIPPLEEIEASIAAAVADERKDSFRPRWEQVRDRLRAAVRPELNEAALPPEPATAAPGSAPAAAGAAAGEDSGR